MAAAATLVDPPVFVEVENDAKDRLAAVIAKHQRVLVMFEGRVFVLPVVAA